MDTRQLQLTQMEGKLKAYSSIKNVVIPPTGWIKAVRITLGMTLQQLATKLSITKQSTLEIEKREQDGSLTIKSLREAAKALDMELVYGLVPKDGSLDKLIDRKAKALATTIVLRTSNTMKLEDQENSKSRLAKAIAERTAILKNEIPKILWD
jgi:predicted DNA-binding mobile mystery protein A